MVESAGRATFLGLDIGTSSVKALLIDADQRVVAEASAGSAVSRPHPLWSEQNPDDWIEGVEAAVAAVRRQRPTRSRPRRNRPLRPDAWRDLSRRATKLLRPAILWNDGRSFAQCIELKRRVPDVLQRTGNSPCRASPRRRRCGSPSTSPKSPATKRVLLPKDYVRLRLTGEAVSEMSDASGTLWLDIGDAALGRGSARRDRLDARTCRGSSRAPSLGAICRRKSPRRGASKGEKFRSRAAPATMRPPPSASARRERAKGFVSLGNFGRRFLRHRSLCQPARADAARVLPRAARALARHVGDAVGGVAACRGSQACSDAATKSAPASTRRGSLRPLAERRRLGADLLALPHRRANAPQRPRGDRHVRRTARQPRRRGARLRGDGGRRLLLRRRRSTCLTRPARAGRPLLVGGGARSGFWGQMISDVTGLTIDVAQGAEAGAALGAARLGMLAAGAGGVEAVCVRPPTAARLRTRCEERRSLRAAALPLSRALQGRESDPGRLIQPEACGPTRASAKGG